MQEIERRIAREANAMTRQEVMKKALAGRITWRQAADLLGICERQMRRLRHKAEQYGLRALSDGRGGKPRRKRIPKATIRELCRLRRDRYLERVFISAYNRRFAVSAAQPERAFTPLRGLDLDLVLSIQHERIVRNDNTVLFGRTFLQLPPSPERLHHARCQVTVHELVDGDLGVSFQGKPLARFSRAGRLRVEERDGKKKKVAYPKPYTAAVAGPLWQQSGYP